MINIHFRKKLLDSFLKVLHLQFFLSLISLPMLVLWGLPISLLSPLGNILFGPVLSLFLFLSSVIFFFELFYIPNQWLIECLDILTNFWLTILSTGSKDYLVTFACNSLFLLIIIPVFALLILHYKKINFNKKIILLLIGLIIFMLILKSSGVKNRTDEIILENKRLFVISKNNEINIIDEYHDLTKSSLSDSFIEYTFLPCLIKKYGHCKINKLFLNFNKRALHFVNSLLNKTEIKDVYFVSDFKIKKIPEFKNVKVNIIEKTSIYKEILS